jgi:hypothetical protein
MRPMADSRTNASAAAARAEPRSSAVPAHASRAHAALKESGRSVQTDCWNAATSDLTYSTDFPLDAEADVRGKRWANGTRRV